MCAAPRAQRALRSAALRIPDLSLFGLRLCPSGESSLRASNWAFSSGGNQIVNLPKRLRRCVDPQSGNSQPKEPQPSLASPPRCPCETKRATHTVMDSACAGGDPAARWALLDLGALLVELHTSGAVFRKEVPEGKLDCEENQTEEITPSCAHGGPSG